MLRAVLFDMGGTLDGDGQHWLDRFVSLYAGHDLDFPRDLLRRAFDAAEARAAVDQPITRMGVSQMVRQHLRWQFEVLGLDDAQRLERMADEFATPIFEAGTRNVPLLAALSERGLALGVVSNACGNARVLCDDLGYTPYLSTVIDSRVVGVAKPDPAIYELALAALNVQPQHVLMVGDSYERDVVPARALGMHTAWLNGGLAGQARRAGRQGQEGEAGREVVVIGTLRELLDLVRTTEQTPA